jgi:hypothetical protein
MIHQFKKHYTVEEARVLLPQIRKWLTELEHLRDRVAKLEKRIEALRGEGFDVGGPSANDFVRCLADMKVLLVEFQLREIQVKDIDRGLIDFPALRDGREIFLCWEKDEEDIEHWHEIDSGYAGREPL